MYVIPPNRVQIMVCPSETTNDACILSSIGTVVKTLVLIISVEFINLTFNILLIQPIVQIGQQGGGSPGIATNVFVLVGLDLILISVVVFALRKTNTRQSRAGHRQTQPKDTARQSEPQFCIYMTGL